MSFKPAATTPTSRTLITRSSLTWPKSKHERIIREHWFNHELEVFLPVSRLSDPLPDWLMIGADATTEEAFYYQVKWRIADFLAPTFISQYVCQEYASTVAITAQRRIDVDDVVALDAKGRLWLNLTKDTYEQLGLDGKPARYAPKGQRFDLTLPAMVPGKKLYERILRRLSATFTRPITFYMVHSKQGKTASITFPSSVKAQRIPLLRQTQRSKDLKLPTFESLRHSSDQVTEHISTSDPTGASHREAWREEALECYEWLGMIACDADRMRAGDSVDPFISLYPVPTPYRIEDGFRCRWRGMITSEQIHRTLMGLWKTLQTASLPWGAMHVWGFVDAPVSWDAYEHGYLLSGEQHYTVMLWKDGTYILYQHVGSEDALN